ncbi:MAG: hypothetical protein KG028_03280, partial [Actinobacteria bacterium]|nr:hypothetical protein [Actinomycetota bacterium]
ASATSWTVTLSADGYTDATDTESVTTVDVAAGNTDIIATPVEVSIQFTHTADPLADLSGMNVTATRAGVEEVGFTAITNATGLASFGVGQLFAPGTWQITTTGAPTGVQNASGSNIVVVHETSPQTIVFDLPTNSMLYGTVRNMIDGELVEGVLVRAQREGESYSGISGPMTDGGYNFSVKARSGTWRITATRDGEEYLVDEAFEIRKDGPDTEPNWLDIVLPAVVTPVIAGQVSAEGGGGVEGATITATSSAGTVSTTTSEDGSYELADLADDVTWAVTFTPPEGYEGQPVTRYVAPGYSGGADITLNQTLPSSLGSIEVSLDGGDAGEQVALTLSETTPFPTLNASGTESVMVTLGAEGTATVTFDGLVPDGAEVGLARFSVTAIGEGRDPVSSSAISVMAGQTTSVSLSLGGATTNVIQVTITSDGEPVADRTVELLSGTGETKGATAAPGSNVYTFSDIEAGEWQVTVPTGGFFPGTIVVTDGQTDYAVDLVAIDEEPTDEPTEETEGTSEGGDDGDAEESGEVTEGTEGTTDEVGDGTSNGTGGDSGGSDGSSDVDPDGTPDPEPTETQTEGAGG